MTRGFGVKRLWLELALALAFAFAALQLGAVYASDARTGCIQGLPALQIELVSADHDAAANCIDLQPGVRP